MRGAILLLTSNGLRWIWGMGRCSGADLRERGADLPEGATLASVIPKSRGRRGSRNRIDWVYM